LAFVAEVMSIPQHSYLFTIIILIVIIIITTTAAATATAVAAVVAAVCITGHSRFQNQFLKVI
jgi:hypothetical protein